MHLTGTKVSCNDSTAVRDANGQGRLFAAYVRIPHLPTRLEKVLGGPRELEVKKVEKVPAQVVAVPWSTINTE